MGAYQRKLEEMVAVAPELELIVAVPPSWKDERGVTPLERAHTRGYRLLVLPLALNGYFHLHFYPTVGRLLREVRPEIVHIDEEPYNLATYHANRLARRQGAKTLWFSWQNLLRHYPPPFSWMEAYNLRHVEHAIAGSQSAAKIWQAKGYAGPLAVIPQFGVDPALFSPSVSPRSDGSVHFAYVGRLVRAKGVDLLLQALSTLDGNWRLTILGSGPDAALLQAMARECNLIDRVAFRPPIPSVEMPNFYREIDVLILPSRSQANWTEQFGRVLTEAMACGKGVVGSDAGEIPYVVGNAGLIFPEGDMISLRAALAQLMHMPALRKALGRRGRARVLAHFTQRHIAEQTVGVYQKMML